MSVKFSKAEGKTKQGKPYKIIYIDQNLPENAHINWFEQKDLFKKYGAKWNNFKKFWFWFYTDENKEVVFDKYIKPFLYELLKRTKSSSEDVNKNVEEVNKYITAVDELIKSVESISSANASAEKITKEDELKVVRGLEDLKNELVNIEDDEEFKRTMKILVGLKDIRGHKYSLYNAMLILVQDRKASWVKSRTNWLKFNRVVKKNAPSILLMRPSNVVKINRNSEEGKEIINQYLKKYKVNKVGELPPGGKEKLNVALSKPKSEYIKYTWYRAYDVRFTEQIPGTKDYYEEYKKRDEIKWAEEGLVDEKVRPLYNALLDFAKSKGINVNLVDDLDGAKGVSKSGSIDILQNEGNDVGLTKTLAHEIAHEILHQKYLKTKDPDLAKFHVGKNSRAAVEQQAEIAAWMIMASYGFNLKTTSINYALLWGADKEGMIKVFDMLTGVVNYMIDEINKRISNDTINEDNQIIKPASHITPDQMASFLGVKSEYDNAKKEVNNNEIVEINDFRKRREMDRFQTTIKKPSISYTAIVLNEQSRKKLINFLNKYLEGFIPEGWKLYAHHITLNLGEATPEIEPYLNTTARFRIVSFGRSDMVVAAGVSIIYPNIESDRKIPHITLAVNPHGGKPRMSNDITKWYPMETKIYFSGKIEEIPFNK